jgi:hypothetical protein
MTLTDQSEDLAVVPSVTKTLELYDVVSSDNCVDVRVKIVATEGLSIDKVCFRLVNKEFHQWSKAMTGKDGVYLARVWDKDWEDQRQRNQYVAFPEPLYIEKDGAGCLVLGNKRVLRGDSLSFRVIVSASKDWAGYIEFCGPSRDGRRACVRRKVTLRLATDQRGFPTE